MTWKTVKLGDVLTQRKKFISIDDRLEYKRCRVQVNRKGVVLRDVVKGLEINTKKQQVCQTGDFIVAEIDAKVGGYGFITDELAGAIVSSHYYLYEVNQDEMLPEYLAYLIQTDIIQDQISAKGSTNYSSIRSHEVLSFEIPLPPLSEQAEFIGQLDRALNSTLGVAALLNRQLSTLTDLRQSILREAVQGQLTTRWRQQKVATEAGADLLKRIRAHKQQLIAAGKLKKEKPLPPVISAETPFELPNGWVWCRLGDLGELVSGVQKGKKYEGDIREVPYLRVANVQRDYLELSQVKTIEVPEHEIEKYQLVQDDILINEGGDFDKVGRACVWNSEIDECIHQNHIFRFRPFESMSIWLNSTINAPHTRTYFISCSKQTTNLASINQAQLRSTLIPLPPLAEQQAIVERVAGLFEKVGALVEGLSTARQVAGQLRQAVLREAFSPQPETVASTA